MLEIPQTPIKLKNYVNGQWQQASGRLFDITSPYTGGPIGVSIESTHEDVNYAIDKAREAFHGWSQTPLKERCQVMFRFREQLQQQMEGLSNIIACESGKTQAEAKAGVNKGIEVLEYALSLQNNDLGGRMEVSRGVWCEYQRVPLGVVAGITPFNFPAMVPMWMLPMALTVGNCFVWKPSDKTPLASQWIAEALGEAGLPPGVLTVLQGGRESVEAIIDHKDIHGVGFVGSTAVAQQVYQRSSRNLKRCLALGSAKNHILLFPDADREMSAQGISDSFTGCAGQRCMAASVLLAVGDVDEIIAAIVEHARQITLGEKMGAIITRESLERLNQAIARAEAEGAKVLIDGRNPNPPRDYPHGHWLGPTILDHVKPNTQTACEELFGPVLSIVRCKDISEAIAIENSSPYGNAASVFTQNGALASQVSQSVRAGMIGINIGVPVPREPFSFGGRFASKFGQGDITGQSGVDFWSDKQKITTKWNRQDDQTWMS